MTGSRLTLTATRLKQLNPALLQTYTIMWLFQQKYGFVLPEVFQAELEMLQLAAAVATVFFYWSSPFT